MSRTVRAISAAARRLLTYDLLMARSGPQALPEVALHAAYRFESRAADDHIEGFVFKKLARPVTWEARVAGADIVATGETRRDAIEAAIAELRHQAK
jgi:hypothetical protein